MTKAGEGILAGVRDALAMAKGDKSRGRTYTIINSKANSLKTRDTNEAIPKTDK